MICAVCRSDNPDGNRFCGHCGTALRPGIGTASSVATLPERSGGERRRVVLMFADVVSSTEIASRMDPEEWRELLTDYHQAAASGVAGMEGLVAQYLGDGVLAYFGWPVAHENDAERAALAAHAILDGVADLNRARAQRGLGGLATRIGLHVGEVVVNRSGQVYGDAPNIAARVQAMASADTVIATEPVVRSIGGRVATEDLGEHSLKGIDRPVHLYRLLSPRRSPRHARRRPRPTRFVGRQHELHAILARWQPARQGQGQNLMLVGEAGIGKSRLVREFRAQIQGTPHLWLESRGSEIFRSTPFYPVLHLFDRLVGPADETRPDGRRRRLRRLLASAGLHDPESVSVMAEVLGMRPLAPDAVDVPLAAERRAQQLRILVDLVLQSVRRCPGVIVLEDLHWVDPSTLALSEALMRSLVDAPLLMIQTARPEFRAPWPPPDGQALITLGRLSQRDTCALVQSTPAGEPLSAAVVESIANRAAGIPLFAEELARTMGAQGRSAQSHEIPDSLSASVNARLDRTGPAREVAQLAAVCGDEVAPEILRAVARRSAAELEPLLERLIEADILVMQPRPTGDVLAFSHSLFREGIYETLLRSQRRELHEDVADTIVTAFPTLASAHPEIIARHLSSAGRHQRAAEAWHSAASVAMSRGAFREAEEACQTALDNLGQLPDAQAHAAVEITIQNALVAALQVTRGYSAAKTREAADRAHELAEKGGSVENVMIEMAARFSALSSAGRYITAGQVADQFLELALREGRRDALAHAYSFQATARYRRGDLAGAERCFQQGEPLFAEAGFLRSLGGVAQTYGTASRNVWMLGRPDEARRRMAYALSVAGANESPYDTAFSTYMAAILAVLMRNAAEGRRLAEQAIDLADANGFRQFATISRVALGRALIDLDPSPRAVDLIETGIAGMAETGSRVAMTLYLAWLAEAQAAVGSLPAAIETIDRALLLNPEELFFRPELLRIRGELWGMSGDVSRADDDMQAALSLAADMEALSLKLRAALSLHRLHARAGSRAATIVAAVYGQFREGHDTADLAEAAAVVRPTTTA